MWKTKRTNAGNGSAFDLPVSSSLRHMDVANAEIGQREIKGDEDNSRIIDYFTATSYHASDDETPWCAAFVNWVLMQAGVARTKSAAALSFMEWGVAVKAPKYGDICVIDRGGGRGHVGFFVGYSKAGRVGILGGNQNDEVNISWFEAEGIKFRRERKLADTNTGKIAIGTATGMAGVAAAKVALAPPASAVAAKVEAACSTATVSGFDAGAAIEVASSLVQFLQGIPLGGQAELVVGALGAMLVALERHRKLKVVNN